jgi:hypothetical protein
MKIAGVYSFNGGEQAVTKLYPDLLTEVNAVIKSIDSSLYKTKSSEEKTMMGRMLFSPKGLNKAFKAAFAEYDDWKTVRVPCDYPTTYYLKDYNIRSKNRGAFREMDFVKNKLGIEVQFGKYAFMVDLAP